MGVRPFFVFGLGFLVEFVIGALGEFVAVGFIFFVIGVCSSSGFLFLFQWAV
jgi:hypothetical protein